MKTGLSFSGRIATHTGLLSAYSGFEDGISISPMESVEMLSLPFSDFVTSPGKKFMLPIKSATKRELGFRKVEQERHFPLHAPLSLLQYGLKGSGPLPGHGLQKEK